VQHLTEAKRYAGESSAVMFNIMLVIGGVLVFLVVGTMFSNWRLKRLVAKYRANSVSEPQDEIAQRVKQIVADSTGLDSNDVFLGMDLEDELGITGDDADALFEEFIKAFPDTDISGLDLSEHFGPEGCAPWALLSRRESVPLHVSDLVQAAREKRWKPIGKSPNAA
jgi:hypothetical protein